ncbi:hypothetical protein PIIN_07455 [Serendipita indica DSM 11827]|uniref:histidine kinase n=1 Tax=Serendipita indica (strain DSM 11827) TaxID=1109443 RepID=G4TQA9_SERID|nr:hypothetical protein PIIN_07455 [Serendipita indica DSM 11827]
MSVLEDEYTMDTASDILDGGLDVEAARQETLMARPSHLGIYDISSVSQIAADGPDGFFQRYAEGKWNPLETPIELQVDPILFSRQDSLRMESTDPRLAAPPDLTQSVEDVYRSFLADEGYHVNGRRVSHSEILLTPRSESNTFTDPGEVQANTSVSGLRLGARSASTAEITGGTYTARAFRRYKELGYLEAPVAADEVQRRRAVRSFKPFHHQLDPNLDRIAKLGKAMFAANASLISLVDEDQVQFTFDGRAPYMVPRGTPMCSHAVLLKADEPLVVLDTLKDWRFRGNKVVTDELSVRFYAGFPMRTESGENIGVFCVLDNKPREKFGSEERALLKELTRMTMRELEGRLHQKQGALRDKMQQTIEMFNREAVSGIYSFELLLERLVDHITRTLSVEGVIILDATGASSARTPSGEQPSWLDKSGLVIPIMAASRHATMLSEVMTTSRRGVLFDTIFKQYSAGFVYSRGDSMPDLLVALLPPEISAAAIAPISRSANEPFAVICIYTLEPNFTLLLPGPTLSFLAAMGLVLCTVRQKQVLSQADKAKVDFIANISHELRTPLHGVLASCELLSETTLNQTQESFLHTAKQCATSLSETISHVLDFTKSTSQAPSQPRTPVDLAHLVEETMISCWLGRSKPRHSDAEHIGDIYAPISPISTAPEFSNRVEPLIDIEPLANWNVLVDKAGLRRVLINLIGNSSKFCQEGYVKISLRRGVVENPTHLPVEIVVEDTGVGMSETFIREKLFHPFSRERPFAEGIGLGLAIVRAILKTPGVDGTIEVQSKVGFGTRMILRFQAPIALQTSAMSLIRNLNKQGHVKFALAGFPPEDMSALQLKNLLRQHLTQQYNSFDETSDIDEAAVLIINDHERLNAIKLLKEPKRRHQKILVLSTSPIDNALLQLAQGLSLGGGVCLVSLKPIGPHALANLLSKLSDQSRPSSPTDSNILKSPRWNKTKSPALRPRSELMLTKADEGTKRPEKEPTVEKEHARPRVLVVEDNAVNRKVLAAYLRKRNLEFVEASNGQEGVSVFEKHRSGYFDICLMDLQMPVLDGFSATQRFREVEAERGLMEDHRRLPIYALSGLAATEDKERASSIGFDGYLVKPVSFITLDGIIESLPPVAKWRTEG